MNPDARAAAYTVSRVCIAAALVLGFLAKARAQSGHAGTYRASPLTLIAEVTTWGTDCGARPHSYTQNERPTVEVSGQGVQLQLAFPDRVLRTDACWSQNPAVKLKSASISGKRWKVECATVPGDPKRETAHYTVVAESSSVLELREESEYQWQLKNSRCIAKVHTIQKLERTDVPKAPATEENAPAADAACIPGPVTRLRLRPLTARIAPGERVCFSVRGTDAQGCDTALDAKRVSYDLDRPQGARGAMSGACFKAAESAADAEGTFRIVGTYEKLRAEASVTVAVPDLSDIIARRSSAGEPLGGDDSAHGGGLAGAGVKALGVRTDGPLPWLLALAGLTMAGGLLAWFVVTRRRQPPLATPAPGGTRGQAHEAAGPARVPENPPASASPHSAPPEQAPIGETAEPLICPQCRTGFAPGMATCSRDGTALVPYGAFVKRAKAAEETRKCPGCGHALTPEALFCGVCGQRL